MRAPVSGCQVVCTLPAGAKDPLPRRALAWSPVLPWQTSPQPDQGRPCTERQLPGDTSQSPQASSGPGRRGAAKGLREDLARGTQLQAAGICLALCPPRAQVSLLCSTRVTWESMPAPQPALVEPQPA